MSQHPRVLRPSQITLLTQIVVVAPAAVVEGYVGGFFKRTVESDGLRIAPAVYERVGTPNRRGAIMHPFTVEQLAELWRVVKLKGHLALVDPYVTSLPADWVEARTLSEGLPPSKVAA